MTAIESKGAAIRKRTPYLFSVKRMVVKETKGKTIIIKKPLKGTKEAKTLKTRVRAVVMEIKAIFWEGPFRDEKTSIKIY